MLEGSILTIITASTPLLIAALGELVAERKAGDHRIVDGMMAGGAVCGFGFASAIAGQVRKAFTWSAAACSRPRTSS